MTRRGWAQTTLGEFLPLEYGKALTEKMRTAGAIPVFGSSGIVGTHVQALTNGPTLIVGRKGNVGQPHLSPTPCWPIDTVYFHEAAPGTDLRFPFYLLLYKSLRGLDRSTAVPGLSRDDYDSVEVDLPPSSEQGRIVDALESYLSRLDAGVANLERSQTKLKAYRASVLKAAVEGRLVPTEAELARAENRHYEPADLLLNRILAERRQRWEEAGLARLELMGKARKDQRWKARYDEPVPPNTSGLPLLPEGWSWASLDQVITEPLANGKSVPDGSGFPVLRLTSIASGIVTLSERKTGDWEGVDPTLFTVKLNDFLIVRGNGSLKLVGRGGRVVSELDPIAYPDTLIRARIAANALNPTLVPRLWDSHPVRRHIERRAKTTAGIYKVNQSDLAETPLPLPPAAEQVRIADELERLDSVGETILHDVSETLDRCGRLRQAILRWAFEGKLVDQDPNDEPAGELLERTRAERVGMAPVKKARGRKANVAS
jgi:type I restriction enzyme S subunit